MPLSLDFALEGFRLIRERPKLIALWGSVTLLGSVVGMLLLVAFAGPLLTATYAIQADIAAGKTATDMSALDKVAEQALPGVAMYLAISMLTSAVITTAVCRAVLERGDDSLGFLKFGLDEVRMLVVNIAMTLMSLVIFVVGGTLGTLAGAAGQMMGMIVSLGFIVWLRVRLSLNCARTFDSGRIDIFGSFAATKDNFSSLAAGYAVALVLALVVYFLCFKVVDAGLRLAFPAVGVPDTTSLHAFLTAPNIISMIAGGGIVEPLLLAILYGAPAAAYLRLKAGRAYASGDVV